MIDFDVAPIGKWETAVSGILIVDVLLEYLIMYFRFMHMFLSYCSKTANKNFAYNFHYNLNNCFYPLSIHTATSNCQHEIPQTIP